MDMGFERLQRRMERLLVDNEVNVEGTQLDVMMNAVVRWLFCYLCPILIVTLIINVTLIFVTPIEIIMSGWFRLKDPLSIVAGYVVVKIFRSLFLHYRSNL
jgi:hypothetical protein